MTPAGVAASERFEMFVPLDVSRRHKPQHPDAFDTLPFTTVVPELKQHITRSPSETGTE